MKILTRYLTFAYLLPMVFLLDNCTNNEVSKPFDCTTSDLELSLVSKVDVTGCNSLDGKITVSASKGKSPYEYNLNGGKFQTSPEFANIGAGNYTVIAKDANSCERSLTVNLSATNTTLNASVETVRNNQCSNPNGSITINGTGGTPPYSYLLGTGGFTSNNVFSNLKDGTYSLIVKDATDCQRALSATVPRENMGISYATQIQPIFDVSCNSANCHGAGNGSRSFTVFSNVFNLRSSIKIRTANRSMPPSGSPSLTQAQIDLIGCWVDDGALNN